MLFLDLGFFFVHIDRDRDCLDILVDPIEALFALARLLVPTLTDSLEHVIAFKVASVSVIIYCDSRMQVNSQRSLLSFVFVKNKVVALLVVMDLEGPFNTLGYQFLIRQRRYLLVCSFRTNIQIVYFICAELSERFQISEILGDAILLGFGKLLDQAFMSETFHD